MTTAAPIVFRVFVISWLMVVAGSPASAYLKFSTTAGNRQVTVKWARTPVRYFVSNQAVPGVTANDLQATVGRAFATWQSVPTSSISYQVVGFTSAQAGEEDGQSTIGFAFRPELNRVLASTSILTDDVTGEIVESDIFFNTAFQWSVSPNGEAGTFDLESIALHEIGHFSGLGHSALGETEARPEGGRRVVAAEAIMFPIAYPSGTVLARTLRADDVAGISDLYPDDGFAEKGSISGRVTRDGHGEFGAHVVAFNPATGALIGNFALDMQGRFVILGLSPGPHIVRVEPIDDADVESYFNSTNTVDIDFRAAFINRLVVVPRGGDSGSIEIPVAGK